MNGSSVLLSVDKTLIHTVTISGTPTGGTFTLTFNGQTTTGLAYNAAAAAVEAALEALSNLTTDEVAVSGSGGGPYTVTLTVAGTLTANGEGLTGGTAPAAAAVGTPDFEVIPCQTSFDLTIAIGEIEQSCKDTPVNQYEPGAIDITASVEVMLNEWAGVSTPNSAHGRLVGWALSQTVFDAQIVVAGVAVEDLTAFITSANIAAPREDSTTLSIDLRITGIPTVAA